MAAPSPQQLFTQAMAHVQALPQDGIYDRRPNVLQAMLTTLHGPDLAVVVNDICNCNGDREQLRKLGKHYITTIFLPCKCLRYLQGGLLNS